MRARVAAAVGVALLGFGAARAQVPAALPGTLPPVVAPADNPGSAAKVELGRLLFWDPRLSGNGSTACASCHLPALGMGERSTVSRGYPGTIHWRNSQTIWNAAHYERLFWDGAVGSLEAQAESAATGAVAGNGNPAMMEMRLRFVPEYVRRFRAVFGTEWPRLTHAWQAIAAFERTLVSDPARVPFDRWVAGDRDALSPAAQRGWALFSGKAGCIRCHEGPLFADQRFHALGVPRLPQADAHVLLQVTARWQNLQRGVSREQYASGDDDLGLEYLTRDARDRGKFRTPSLRELRHTAPYMHNGAFATLREVVDFFDRGGGDTPTKPAWLQPLGLSDDDKRDLVAFLESLSMDELPAMPAPELPPTRPLPVAGARDGR